MKKDCPIGAIRLAFIINPAILLFLLTSLFSCSKSSIENAIDKGQIEDSLGEEVIGDLTAKVNGENFKALKIKEFIIGSITTSEELYVITIAAVDIESGAKNAKAMGLYMIGQDFNRVGEGKIYNTVVNDLFTEGALAGYYNDINSEDDDSDDSFFGPEEIKEIYIKITALDREKQLISGEFNFKGSNKETEVLYVISDGEFTNIAYKFHEN